MSIATINITLQLLDIYIYIDVDIDDLIVTTMGGRI